MSCASTKPSHRQGALGDATVLRHVKGLVLAMLENRQAPIFCAWLRSRRARKRAAPLTRLALRGLRMVSGRGTSQHIDATRSPHGVEQGTDVGRCMPVGRDAHGLDEHQGKMRRDNCQWQQPTVTAYRSPAPLRPARSGVHDHRNRCSRSTGLAVHDRRNAHLGIAVRARPPDLQIILSVFSRF